VVGEKTRRSFHLLVGATLTIGAAVIGSRLTAPTDEHSLRSILGWLAAGIIVTFFYLRWQLRSQEERPEAIKERVTQLEPELRNKVQARSYGVRRNLIEAPLRELDLDITPRVGWVRDARLVEPEPSSERTADDIVAAFESSKRRLLIVGEPGSGKTMAAYSLIEYLDEREDAEGRIPLLVNLSAWEAQDDFEAFLVDYLCSSVGYDVRARAVADAFVKSRRYNLILDGLDEIPARLRAHFRERLDEFVKGLQSKVAVVVTCRTQEYEELLAARFTGLGLVQAVEILPLSSEQLDSAFVELAQLDKDWGAFLSQRRLTAYRRVRHLLSNPLFLNLAVVGHLSPEQLLDSTTTEQDLRDLVLESYLVSTLADQGPYEPQDARRYLSWIARFLGGVEVSPFGFKTTDYSVFNLADLTPNETPRRYRLAVGLVLGLGVGLSAGRILGINWGLVLGLLVGLFTWTFGRFANSVQLIVAWPSNKRQFHYLLILAGITLVGTLTIWLILGRGWGPDAWLFVGLSTAFLLVLGLVQPGSLLITSRTQKEVSSRSLIAALTYLTIGFVVITGFAMLSFALGLGMTHRPSASPLYGPLYGLLLGLYLALNNGGWFVLLQKVAHRHLARAGNLPSSLYDFLEWGIDRQVFRRVGGGVRFRHALIQQHLASTSD
jgi:hypothetical protein